MIHLMLDDLRCIPAEVLLPGLEVHVLEAHVDVLIPGGLSHPARDRQPSSAS